MNLRPQLRSGRRNRGVGAGVAWDGQSRMFHVEHFSAAYLGQGVA